MSDHRNSTNAQVSNENCETARSPLKAKPTDMGGKTGQRTRKDETHLHAMRHGFLSRHPLEALMRAGENTRQLRSAEKLLREELKPQGIEGKIVFDRAWSSYLRSILIARVESRMLVPVGRRDAAADLPRRPGGDLMPEPDFLIPIQLLQVLTITQRYDRHFSQEFYRAVSELRILYNSSESRIAEIIAEELSGGSKISESSTE